jgi:hypothetical protein
MRRGGGKGGWISRELGANEVRVGLRCANPTYEGDASNLQAVRNYISHF